MRPRDVVGPTRLAAFTMWHFALIGVSYAVSGAATWIHSSGGTVPEWILISPQSCSPLHSRPRFWSHAS